MKEIVQQLMSTKRYEDLYILARYMYRTGRDMFDNEVFDKIESVLIKNKDNYPKLFPYFETTYDEDPIPYALLSEFSLPHSDEDIEVNLKERYEHYEYLAEDKTKSINSVYELEDSVQYFIDMRNNQRDLEFSLKTDGLCNKMLYHWDNFEMDISRARGEDAKAIDYTMGARYVMPPKIVSNLEFLKVVGESYVELDYLPTLREKYDTSKYKTPKGASKSMLVLPHDAEDYRRMKIKVFYVEGIADTYSEMFRILEEQGVDTVPNFMIKWEEIPQDIEELKDWICTKMEYFMEYAHIPSDGIVVCPNDMNIPSVEAGKYNLNQIALKFGNWKAIPYSSRVVGFEIEQQRVFASVVILIEPLLSKDNSTLGRVNGYNPAILIEDDIKVGTNVIFERDSGTVSKLMRGKSKGV